MSPGMVYVSYRFAGASSFSYERCGFNVLDDLDRLRDMGAIRAQVSILDDGDDATKDVHWIWEREVAS